MRNLDSNAVLQQIEVLTEHALVVLVSGSSYLAQRCTEQTCNSVSRAEVNIYWINFLSNSAARYRARSLNNDLIIEGSGQAHASLEQEINPQTPIFGLWHRVLLLCPAVRFMPWNRSRRSGSQHGMLSVSAQLKLAPISNSNALECSLSIPAGLDTQSQSLLRRFFASIMRKISQRFRGPFGALG